MPSLFYVEYPPQFVEAIGVVYKKYFFCILRLKMIHYTRRN